MVVRATIDLIGNYEDGLFDLFEVKNIPSHLDALVRDVIAAMGQEPGET